MNLKVKKSGFTLIEIVVTVSTIGVIMMVVVGTILQTMKAQNRNRGMSELSDQGNWILSELRKNAFNSGNLSCSSDNLSIGVTNLFNGASSRLSCDIASNSIASTSGKTIRKLNSAGIKVINCDNFVKCSTYEEIAPPDEDGVTTGDTRVLSVAFSFGIGTSVAGVGVSQTFTTTVTLRN